MVKLVALIVVLVSCVSCGYDDSMELLPGTKSKVQTFGRDSLICIGEFPPDECRDDRWKKS